MVGEVEGRVTIRVAGRKGDYWKYTITSWLHEIKDILEQEYGIRIRVIEEDEDRDLPAIYIEDQEVGEGVPGEEGYLIEVLKKALDRIVGRRSE